MQHDYTDVNGAGKDMKGSSSVQGREAWGGYCSECESTLVTSAMKLGVAAIGQGRVHKVLVLHGTSAGNTG